MMREEFEPLLLMHCDYYLSPHHLLLHLLQVDSEVVTLLETYVDDHSVLFALPFYLLI